ncbi:MAG: squalene synthase HpnC [Quisquiliibacterium sp.]
MNTDTQKSRSWAQHPTDQSRTGWLSGVDHYENFPVASVLMPARLRPAVLAIYRFARYADDVADEGDAACADRIDELNLLREQLLAAEHRPATHPVISQLKPWVDQYSIPIEPFLELLSAFEQDVRVHRFADRAALLDYCRRSAQPIGRLILHLYGISDKNALLSSDSICSALQLINFVQDIAIDWRRGRLYIPLDELGNAGLTTEQIALATDRGEALPALRDLIRMQGEMAHALLESGSTLVSRVPLRLSIELRAVLAGATRILQQLSHSKWDPFKRRPKLRWRDAPAIARLMISRPLRLR